MVEFEKKLKCGKVFKKQGSQVLPEEVKGKVERILLCYQVHSHGWFREFISSLLQIYSSLC